jgi:hypothetical protein
MLFRCERFSICMKRHITLILTLVCSANLLFSQTWIKKYGIGNNSVVWDITEQYDHSYLYGASLFQMSYGWIFKTDINGENLWEIKIGNGSYNIAISDIEATYDGGFIIGGGITKFSPSWDAFLIKFNSCAEIEWCKVLLTLDNYDLSWRIKQTPEGDFILLGAYFVTNPESNISLFKFNTNGELIWHQFYPFEYYYSEDQPKDLLVDYDGYLVTSTRYAPDTGTTSPQVSRSYFVKTDTAGNKLWDLTYGTENQYYSYPWATTKNSNGKYYHSSTHSPPSGENPALVWVGHDGLTSGYQDIFQMNNFYFSGFSTITMEDDANIILVGALVDNQGITNWKIIKIDTTGYLLDSASVAFVNSSYTSTTKTFDNKFITVGNDAPNGNFNIVAFKVNSDLEYDSIYTQPFTYDSLCPHPIVSDTIDPNCDNVIVSVDEPFKKPETTQLKVYPNPTDRMLTVDLPKYLVVSNTSGSIPATTIYHQWSSATLQAIDLQGKTVLQQEVANTGLPLHLDVSRLPAGMYQFRLVYQGKQVAGSKVVVK